MVDMRETPMVPALLVFYSTHPVRDRLGNSLFEWSWKVSFLVPCQVMTNDTSTLRKVYMLCKHA
jgi:hypothetical protein